MEVLLSAADGLDSSPLVSISVSVYISIVRGPYTCREPYTLSGNMGRGSRKEKRGALAACPANDSRNHGHVYHEVFW